MPTYQRHVFAIAVAALVTLGAGAAAADSYIEPRFERGGFTIGFGAGGGVFNGRGEFSDLFSETPRSPARHRAATSPKRMPVVAHKVTRHAVVNDEFGMSRGLDHDIVDPVTGCRGGDIRESWPDLQ